jgi:uncharacterized protein
MKITGTYELKASTEVIWQMLMDSSILEKVTPGIEKLELKAEDLYSAISQVRVGPVKGVFEGELALRNKVDGESCLLVIDQKSKMGNVVAEIGILLEPTDTGNTQVRYTGEARMSGTLARTGQRIMSGVVSTLSKQFFQALEKEVEAASAGKLP